MLRDVIIVICLYSTLTYVHAQAVGPLICKDCHPKIYQQWSMSAHAKGMSTLPRHQQRNPYCLTCHVDPIQTNMLALEMFNIANTEVTTSSQGVSYEACHGYAKYYITQGTKQQWWNLKYNKADKYTPKEHSNRLKRLKKIKEKAKKLGLKKAKNITICQRCHDGISSKLIPVKLHENFRHDLSSYDSKKTKLPTLTHPL